MTVACAKPINKTALFEFISSKIPIRQERFEKTLVSLMSHKIVIPIDKVEAISTHINRWKEAGWDDASDYHFFTWDASFLDYSKEGQGHDIDRKKMVCYQSLQPNTERFKKYEAHLFEIELPSLDHSDSRTENLSIIERVKYLLACIFGRTLLSCEEQALQVGVVILLKGTS